MKKKILHMIENVVDATDGKVIDYVSILVMIITSIGTGYLFISSLEIIRSPIIKNHSFIPYTLIFLLTLFLFYLSMLGDKTSKPVNRPRIYLFMTVVLSLGTYSLLAEIFNYIFTQIIDYILVVAEVPSFLINTNVRLVTVFIPALIVVLVFSKSYKIPFVNVYRKELLEYQIDLFTRNVHKITDETVDLNLCEDVDTGNDIVIAEKVTYQHKMVSGSSGSGKTALRIRPDLAQLMFMKATFKERLKELTYEALKEGLCYINIPITNKYFNDNFSMDFITIHEGKKEQYIEKFKKYIIGVRNSEKQIYCNKARFVGKEPIKLEIPINIHSDINKIVTTLNVYVDNMIKEEIPFEFKRDIDSNIDREEYSFKIQKKAYTRITKSLTDEIDEEGKPVYEEVEEYIEKEIGEGQNLKTYSEYLDIVITPKKDSYSRYSFNITVDEHGEGKIIYRNLGVTVIAPDGGLAKDTVEIAESNGVNVHRIDPKMEEILKGGIAKFNPLLVGTPEKAGDILSSILVAMEQTSGKDSNPYFTNASIRAIRNVVILQKVMHPILNNGENPVLTDILEMLNNFNLVIPYVNALKKDNYLKNRWKSIIDYFETCFYPPDVDEKGKQIPGSHIGCKTKKTEEAIGGIINQLDNFLGREEIRYIFCDRENSLDFSEVLEKGECIAVSTRQSELGEVLGKAFALMIILSIQNSVLGRYSEDENPEIPYHLIIDEFPFYVNDQTKVFFTFARKYKCAMTIAIQNLAQLEEVSRVFREVIFTNCSTKVILPGSNVEDREYFCKYFGIKEQFEIATSVNSNPVVTENAKYSEAARGSITEKNNVSEQELAELKFKRCYYSTIDKKGNNIVGKGYMDFVKLTSNNTVVPKILDFEQFNNISDKTKENDDKKIENNDTTSNHSYSVKTTNSQSGTISNNRTTNFAVTKNTILDNNEGFSVIDSNSMDNIEEMEDILELNLENNINKIEDVPNEQKGETVTESEGIIEELSLENINVEVSSSSDKIKGENNNNKDNVEYEEVISNNGDINLDMLSPVDVKVENGKASKPINKKSNDQSLHYYKPNDKKESKIINNTTSNVVETPSKEYFSLDLDADIDFNNITTIGIGEND